MRLLSVLMPQWPCLAWLAYCNGEGPTVTVFHGAKVEKSENWVCEAVWAGEYEAGGFDQTDLVAGTGVRLRNGNAVFVSSGSTLDRLHSHVRGGHAWVSNSLPCLLAAIGGELEPSEDSYFAFLGSIIGGLERYDPWLPTSVGPVRLTYFDNLVWAGGRLDLTEKPDEPRDLSTFVGYRSFVESTFRQFGHNMRDAHRKHAFEPLGTLSGGYDSPTITVLAREAGLREAICVDRARDGGEEKGAEIARHIGIEPHVIDRDAWRSQTFAEVPFIVGDALGESVYLSGGKHLLGSRVLFTGYHGDNMWGKHVNDLSRHLVRHGDRTGMSLTEFRLNAGFLHCVVPFWGARQIADLNRMNNSPDLAAWDVPGDYSRPFCRRIVEEAGVPRELFGNEKRAIAVLLNTSPEFLTPASFNDYLSWLRRNRWRWVRRGRVPPLASPRADQWEQALRGLVANMARKPWLRHLGLRRLAARQKGRTLRLRRHVFPWAVDRVRGEYSCRTAVDFRTLPPEAESHK
jgi:hypothetical protein